MLEPAAARILTAPSSSSGSDGAYTSPPEAEAEAEAEVEAVGDRKEEDNPDDTSGRTRPKEFRSSWDAKDSQGNDYLFRLGQESANMNINVGARQGIIDDLFVGNFLGKDGTFCCDHHHHYYHNHHHHRRFAIIIIIISIKDCYFRLR
jgi:hypothetical protein